MTDWVYSYELHQVPVVASNPTINTTTAKYVLLVSGLLIGSTEPNAIHDHNVQQLVEFISGRYGDDSMTALASRIAR